MSAKNAQNGHVTEHNSSKEKGEHGDVIDDIDIDYEEDVFRCGYFSWKPDWLQGCNTPRMLLVCICWFTFTQGQLE